MLYLIEILHQTTTIKLGKGSPCCCILSKFYIKPQHPCGRTRLFWVVSYRNSTSNHNSVNLPIVRLIVVSYRNSTSNHNRVVTRTLGGRVVSYRNSTSNHNTGSDRKSIAKVVSYRNSTSNHNHCRRTRMRFALYLIEILHQTTTASASASSCCWLYLIEILHQTTTSSCNTSFGMSLYLIEILHQTTTRTSYSCTILGCILSKFYIKPQQLV